MKRRTLVLGAVLGGAAVIAVALVLVSVLGGSKSTPTRASGSAQVDSMLRGIPQRGNVLGSPRAPVTLVEYADLQCPYCGQWARLALPEVVRRYVRPGKVKVVFRGMWFVGSDSETALRTVVAAGRQNRFWHVLDLLYENQGAENSGWVTDGLLRSVGGSVTGLDVGRMLSERGSATVDSALSADAAAAKAAGIESTPSFEVGRSGGPMRRVQVQSLDVYGIAPALDSLLAG